MRVIGILLDTIMLFPPLALPLAVAVVGEIVFFWLMTRSPEDQERLLFSVVLLPVHALTFVMMVYCVFDPKIAPVFIQLYFSTAPLLLLGLIAYLCFLCRRKLMNRYLWMAAAVWALYFVAIAVLIVFAFLLMSSFQS